MAANKSILTPDEVVQVRWQAAHAIAPLRPPQKGGNYKWADSRTYGGRELPPYHLVYFLLADLLNFPKGGRWEKTAWSIPVDFNGYAATIEYRKMGLGVFCGKTPEDEAVAAEIVAAVKKGVNAARRYFDHLAATAVTGSQLNVTNRCSWLFARYTYLKSLFKEKTAAIKNHSLYDVEQMETISDDGTKTKNFILKYSDAEEAKWLGVAAIEAFFSWTEQVLIHIGILLGKVTTGAEVSAMTEMKWQNMVKAVIDLSTDMEMKGIFEELLNIRSQVRNYMAHGAFGKQGEAFLFHSPTGAVTANLTGRNGGISMWIGPSFEESRAIDVMESFIKKLWEGERAPAKLLLDDADLPVILSHASDGIYKQAMASEEIMEKYIKYLSREVDDAANMDW